MRPLSSLPSFSDAEPPPRARNPRPGLISDAHRAAATFQAGKDKGAAAGMSADDDAQLRRSFVSQNFRTMRVQSGFDAVDNSNRPFVLPAPLNAEGAHRASSSLVHGSSRTRLSHN